MKLVFRVMLVAAVAVGAGCQTVQVHTTPDTARVEVDGEDISETRQFKEGVGFKAHTITVKKRGYAPATVALARDRMVPWLKWTALVTALSCATLSSCAAANCGYILCNRNIPATLLGYTLGSLLGLGGGDPFSALLNVAVVQSLAPDITTVPGMAVCGLLGAWPLVGLLVPVVFPRSAATVEVVLTPQEDSATDAAADAPAPAPATTDAPQGDDAPKAPATNTR